MIFLTNVTFEARSHLNCDQLIGNFGEGAPSLFPGEFAASFDGSTDRSVTVISISRLRIRCIRCRSVIGLMSFRARYHRYFLGISVAPEWCDVNETYFVSRPVHLATTRTTYVNRHARLDFIVVTSGTVASLSLVDYFFSIFSLPLRSFPLLHLQHLGPFFLPAWARSKRTSRKHHNDRDKWGRKSEYEEWQFHLRCRGRYIVQTHRKMWLKILVVLLWDEQRTRTPNCMTFSTFC